VRDCNSIPRIQGRFRKEVFGGGSYHVLTHGTETTTTVDVFQLWGGFLYPRGVQSFSCNRSMYDGLHDSNKYTMFCKVHGSLKYRALLSCVH
jgi:hypothetical protein